MRSVRISIRTLHATLTCTTRSTTKRLKMKHYTVRLILLVINTFNVCFGNLEGPFLFWGPKSLETYRRPALKNLEQDDLIQIYDKQSAIVVFNNQDSVPLSSENFPRLRKLLESKATLVLPQDFLDVHPDYVNNETQVFTLQGPNSERDAEITETFNRLEDIYGKGKVLGVLGNSVSQDYLDRTSNSDEYQEERGIYERSRRDAPEGTAKEEANQPKYAIYNARDKALLYSSTWPMLRYGDGEGDALGDPLTATVDARDQITRVVVSFSREGKKIILTFRFPTKADGTWRFGDVEVQDFRSNGTVVLAPAPPESRGANRGFSYHCSQPLVFTNGLVTLSFTDIQVQPVLLKGNRFGDAFHCVGFTTVPILSGLGVSGLLILGVAISTCWIMDIKSMDRFENAKGKVLQLTISE